MTIDPKRGNDLLSKLLKTKTLPIVPDPKPGIPPGLKFEPKSPPSTPSFRPLSAQQEFNEENEDLALAQEVKQTFMDNGIRPGTEQNAVLVQDRQRLRALQSSKAQGKPQTSTTKKQRSESSLAMPVDQESSLFSMTPEQHQKMVEQARAEFLSAKKPSTKET